MVLPVRNDLPSRLACRPARLDSDARTGAKTGWWCCFGLWAFATACNLGKPFHIDDTAHLEITRWILAHPLHPMTGLVNWSGSPEPIARLNQPHLYFYLMAAWERVFGDSEIAIHALMALCTGAAIAVFYRLALLFRPPVAIWLTVLFCLGPAFVIGQNTMVDVPLVGLWIGFFFCLLRYVREPRPDLLALAGILCGAAVLVKYSSLALLPAMVLLPLACLRPKHVAMAAMPLVIVLAWSGFNLLDYGRVHMLDRPENPFAASLVAGNAVSWVMTLGGVVPFGIVAGSVLLHRRSFMSLDARPVAVASALVGLAALAGGVYLGIVPDTESRRILITVFAANGVATIAVVLLPLTGRLSLRGDAHSRLELLILLYWIAASTGFYIMFTPFMATRHVLTILPAMTLLVGVLHERQVRGAAGWCMALASAALTIVLTISDWNFAMFYKTEAPKLRQSVPVSAHVWFTGHWGWQWYAEHSGLRELDVHNPRFAPGDYLAVPLDLGGDDPINSDLKLTELRTDRRKASWRDLFCTANPASFYDSNIHLPPWTISRHCGGQITMFRIGVSRPG